MFFSQYVFTFDFLFCALISYSYVLVFFIKLLCLVTRFADSLPVDLKTLEYFSAFIWLFQLFRFFVEILYLSKVFLYNRNHQAADRPRRTSQCHPLWLSPRPHRGHKGHFVQLYVCDPACGNVCAPPSVKDTGPASLSILPQTPVTDDWPLLTHCNASNPPFSHTVVLS